MAARRQVHLRHDDRARLDVAQHVCASEGWGPPADNGDALRLLGSHGVLVPELANRLRRAAGFGNVLARLDDPSDLAGFVAAVAEWIATDGVV